MLCKLSLKRDCDCGLGSPLVEGRFWRVLCSLPTAQGINSLVLKGDLVGMS